MYHHPTQFNRNTLASMPFSKFPTAPSSSAPPILICVAGRGYYQEEGKAAIEMKPGDCINIPAEVKHWHGAAPDEWFSHLAIEVPGEETANEWYELLSDKEYAKLK